MMDEAELLKQAQAERPRVSVASLGSVIAELRSKGFSFRAISEWLAARGVSADHNAVYRVYRRSGQHASAAAAPETLQPVVEAIEPDGDPVRWL